MKIFNEKNPYLLYQQPVKISKNNKSDTYSDCFNAKFYFIGIILILVKMGWK